MKNRLYDIVNLSNDYLNLLDKFNLNEQESIVLFKREHLLNIINKFINSKISLDNLEKWANIIESNDYIKIIPEKDNILLNDIIYEIWNPILEWPLTIERAKNIISKLEG